MSTNRNLLTLAARAVGLSIEWDGSDLDRALILPANSSTLREWNPLQNDSDALRLVTALKLHIGMESNVANAWASDDYGNFQTVILDHFGDEAALRRAIVLAAAAASEKVTS